MLRRLHVFFLWMTIKNYFELFWIVGWVAAKVVTTTWQLKHIRTVYALLLDQLLIIDFRFSNIHIKTYECKLIFHFPVLIHNYGNKL